jgi:hypothetical protein
VYAIIGKDGRRHFINHELFCDLNLFIFLSYLLPMLTKYVFDIFKDFQRTLITCNLNNVHLKWKTTSLDLNTLGGEYLAFDSSSYTFWVTCVNAIGEKVQVI